MYPYDTNIAASLHASGDGSVYRSIWIHKTDDNCVKLSKLSDIEAYVTNPTFYLKHLIQGAGYMAHEIMIDGPIPLDKYLISICFTSFDKKISKKIYHIMKKRYPHVKILDIPKDKYGQTPAPILEDILNNCSHKLKIK
jgi:hypothetical protein